MILDTGGKALSGNCGEIEILATDVAVKIE